MQIPALIIAGDSVSWTESALSDPVQGALTAASGWSLTYSFRGQQGAGGIDVAATAAGTAGAGHRSRGARGRRTRCSGRCSGSPGHAAARDPACPSVRSGRGVLA